MSKLALRPSLVPTLLAAVTPATFNFTNALRILGAMSSRRPGSLTKFEFVVPILNVKNVPASLEYYVEKLGFKMDWDWGTPPTFASVSRDSIKIFLCEGAQGQSGTWMQMFVHDVDALHEEYKKSGAIIRQPPTNFPWNTREMNVADLDGHRFRMSSEATGSDDGKSLPKED